MADVKEKRRKDAAKARPELFSVVLTDPLVSHAGSLVSPVRLTQPWASSRCLSNLVTIRHSHPLSTEKDSENGKPATGRKRYPHLVNWPGGVSV